MWPQLGLGKFCIHRWSAPHHFTKDRSKWLRTCRYCQKQIVSWFDDKDGKIIENVIYSNANEDITGTPEETVSKSA